MLEILFKYKICPVLFFFFYRSSTQPVLPTPPSSDGILSAAEEAEQADHSRNFNNNVVKNPNVKSRTPRVTLNRLSDDEVRFLSSRQDQLSGESRPKKRPRLTSTDNSNGIDHIEKDKHANHPTKSNGTLSNGSLKKSSLFGDDSDDSETDPETPSNAILAITNNSFEFNHDDLDFDAEDVITKETTPRSKSPVKNHHSRLKDSSKSEKDKSSSKKKQRDKDKPEQKRSEKSKETSKSDQKKSPKDKSSHRGKRDDSKKTKNPSTWRIPKIANPAQPPLSLASTTGLPTLLQENLQQALKVASSSLQDPSFGVATATVGETQYLLQDSSIQQVTMVDGSKSLTNPTVFDETCTSSLDQMVSNHQVSSVPSPILCLVPNRKERPKSVVFSENLTSVHTISPPSSSIRTSYTAPENRPISPYSSHPSSFLHGELGYVPKFSTRPPTPPVPGIRP